jgi:hypothetical protein
MSSVQTFTYTTCAAQQVTLQPGTYRFEVWGASGGSNKASGGLGGYSKGELTLSESTAAFVNVGQQGGSYSSYNCNGGGKGSDSSYRSGGGGTDIRLISNSLYSRIIVAGGGGGAGDYSAEHGGYGGGLNGKDGDNDESAGRGASQDSETIGCVGGSTSCANGIFGYGGNATSSGGGGGGGWFGGSSGSGTDAGGGGSGYILTSSSYKPSGYTLTNSKYYLKNAQTLGGNNAFPSPTSSGSETGHSGHGYVKITTLTPLATPVRTPKATPTATPKATMIGIEPELNFFFTSLNGDVIKDRLSIFRFNSINNYTSEIIPGRYVFYANGSFCGQSVYVQHNVNSLSTMNISISSGITISINNEPFLKAPGSASSFSTFIDPRALTFSNFSMSDYHCEGTGSSLKILYHPFNHCSCQGKLSSRLNKFFLIALLSY